MIEQTDRLTTSKESNKEPWARAMGQRSCWFACVWVLAGILVPGVARAEPEIVEGKKVYRMGLSATQFSGTNLRDAEVAMDFWMERMSERQGNPYTAKTEAYHDVSEMMTLAREGHLDIVGMLTYEYLALADASVLEPFSYSVRDKTRRGEACQLLVRRDSGIEKIEDLSGRKINLELSSTGELTKIWLEVLLKRAKLPPCAVFFSEVSAEEKISETVLPVFFKQVDACVALDGSFSTMVEMNPSVGKNLIVLESSGDLMASLLCFNTALSEKDKEDIRSTALTFHEDPGGEQILALFRIEQIVKFEPQYLESIKSLYREYIGEQQGELGE